MGDRDDHQLVSVKHVDDAIRPPADVSPADILPKPLTDFRELKEQRKFCFYCFYESLAVSEPLFVVVVARLKKLAASVITNDENAGHTSNATRE